MKIHVVDGVFFIFIIHEYFTILSIVYKSKTNSYRLLHKKKHLDLFQYLKQMLLNLTKSKGSVLY